MRLSVSFLHGRFYSCVLALDTTNNMCTKIWAIVEANILVNIMVSPSGVPLEVSPEARLCLFKCFFFSPTVRARHDRRLCSGPESPNPKPGKQGTSPDCFVYLRYYYHHTAVSTNVFGALFGRDAGCALSRALSSPLSGCQEKPPLQSPHGIAALRRHHGGCGGQWSGPAVPLRAA